MYSPPPRRVRTMLLHGLKPVWFSSTVPPKIQKPLSAAIKCPATDANGAKSHSENSSRQKRSFTVTRPDPKMGRDPMSVVDGHSVICWDSEINVVPSGLVVIQTT